MAPKYGNSDTNLLCTPLSVQFVCSSTEVNTNEKINLDHTPQSQDIQQALDKLCDKYKYIFQWNQGDIGYTKWLTIDNDTGDHPPTAYTLPLKHSQWVQEELEMLEKVMIIYGEYPLGLVLLLS